MAQSIARLLKDLSSASPDTKFAALENISKLSKEEIEHAAQSSDLLLILSKLMKENEEEWSINIPESVNSIIIAAYSFREVTHDHTLALVDVLLEMFQYQETYQLLSCLKAILFTKNKLEFLDHPQLFSIFCTLREAIFSDNIDVCSGAIQAFLGVTDNCEEWQKKVIQDEPLVLRMLAEENWPTLLNLAQYPDAKVMLPREVLEQARGFSYGTTCKSICAILGNESDASNILMDEEYIDGRSTALKNLLEMRDQKGLGGENLLDIMLPFVNLSINDATKDKLGELLISMLLQIVAIKETDDVTALISFCLKRGRQEAAKTLWNLSFSEANQRLIEEEGGIDTLEQIVQGTEDAVLKTNISGVLFMFSKPSPSEVVPSASEKQGHVMISYSWSHQPIVIRLAQSLKKRGYSIWLDIEQMKGSTLGSMADAIEGSDIVLMCVSQKYKDSPNCRLEGEYCVSRKIPFIPIMVQQGYRADGWLGFILGTRLYHNFTDENDWETKMTALMNEIGDNGKSGTPILQQSLRASNSSLALSTSSHTTSARDWSVGEVLSWLKSEKMAQHCNEFAENKINGAALLELKSFLVSSSPKLFIYCIEKLNIRTAGEVLRLSAALKKL